MWNLTGFLGEGMSNGVTSSYLSVMHEVHVLLVDHDSGGLVSTTQLLEMCHYKVSAVEFASAGISMLTNGKVKFDFILANINSPDLHGFRLLQQAVNMNIPVILLSVDDNVHLAMRALENGALMYVKKPPNAEMLSGIWQHVARERIRALRERGRQMAANYNNVQGIEHREAMAPHNSNDHNPNPNPIPNMVRIKDNGRSKKGYYGRNGDRGYDSDRSSNIGKGRRKVCTEWTQELHEKFMNAIQQLGEGRCFPKEILELMNEPGLTRMQVASHLQKCRNDNWRSPDERGVTLGSLSSDGDGAHHRSRRFGSMPRLGKTPSYQVEVFQTTEGAVEQGSQTTKESDQMEIDAGGSVDQNMAVSGPSMANISPLHQLCGAIIPHSNNVALGMISSSNPSPEDYFSFQEMDCLIQNFSNVPQGSETMNHPHSSSDGYNFEQFHGHDQNSRGAEISMENMRNQWTSTPETPNFGSTDESETRGH